VRRLDAALARRGPRFLVGRTGSRRNVTLRPALILRRRQAAALQGAFGTKVFKADQGEIPPLRCAQGRNDSAVQSRKWDWSGTLGGKQSERLWSRLRRCGSLLLPNGQTKVLIP